MSLDCYLAERAGETELTTSVWDPDTWGVICSIGCAVHCAITPLIISMLPMITTARWLAHPLVHQIAAVICSLLAVWAIWPAYRRHRVHSVAVIAGCGLICLLIAAFSPTVCCPASAAEPITWQTIDWQVPTALESNQPRLTTTQISPREMLAGLTPDELGGNEPFWSVWLTPLGGALLIVAHLWNTQLRCRHKQSAACC